MTPKLTQFTDQISGMTGLPIAVPKASRSLGGLLPRLLPAP